MSVLGKRRSSDANNPVPAPKKRKTDAFINLHVFSGDDQWTVKVAKGTPFEDMKQNIAALVHMEQFKCVDINNNIIILSSYLPDNSKIYIKSLQPCAPSDYIYRDSEVVWARLEDFPWWPAQCDFASFEGDKGQNHTPRLPVRWFGEDGNRVDLLTRDRIIPFDLEIESDLLRQHNVEEEDGVEYIASVNDAMAAQEQRKQNAIAKSDDKDETTETFDNQNKNENSNRNNEDKTSNNNEQKVLVTVKFAGDNNPEHSFVVKAKLTTKLDKICTAFAQRHGEEFHKLRFMNEDWNGIMNGRVRDTDRVRDIMNEDWNANDPISIVVVREQMGS
eukprot:91299_1